MFRFTPAAAAFALLSGLTIFSLSACRPVEDSQTNAIWSDPTVEYQESGTKQLLIGLDAHDERVVWAGGTRGTFVRTVDGGATWHVGRVREADTLQFRDVHAIDERSALLLSIGTGEQSRVYRTSDAGESWELLFANPEADAFFDCFDFWEDGSGIAFSDAVDGRFPLAFTTDGTDWSLRRGPEAQPGEGGFAASGTCLVAIGDSTVLIGTGNAGVARVLRSDDRGTSWKASPTPIVAGDGAGITTLAFRDDMRGIALGGDLARPAAYTDNVSVTTDGGRTWRPAAHPTFTGAVYGSSVVPGSDLVVAVGPNGASFSSDNAATWSRIDSLSYWSIDFVGPSAGWAVGPEGRIARIRFRQRD